MNLIKQPSFIALLMILLGITFTPSNAAASGKVRLDLPGVSISFKGKHHYKKSYKHSHYNKGYNKSYNKGYHNNRYYNGYNSSYNNNTTIITIRATATITKNASKRLMRATTAPAIVTHAIAIVNSIATNTATIFTANSSPSQPRCIANAVFLFTTNA